MSTQTKAPHPDSGLYWIPFFGWMLRDLHAGHKDAPLWFMLVVAMFGGIAGIMWGVWAFLLLFLTLTPIFLVGYTMAAFSAIAPDLSRGQQEKIAMQERIAKARAQA